jgi:nitrile hydratase accessory protein
MAPGFDVTTYRPSRNLVTRHLDGKQVNVARFRGNLFVCSQACCCGREDLKNAPVPLEAYQAAWEIRRLRNFVHLTVGGCLGPCALANVTLLLLDGQALWFHSMNDSEVVRELFDYIEATMEAGAVLPLSPELQAHAFTASAWQARPDGAPLDDARAWRGRDARPDATPACELPTEAFLPGDYGCETATPPATEPGVLQAVAAMEGVTALPRSNGELLFQAPWEGRAFGMAVALHEEGVFEWEAFRARLIARVAEAERRPEPFEYYRCWLAALEDVLAASGLAAPEALDERTFEFEFGERQDVY